ncbi:hypothetical protein K438DRAFT_349095 [Mycena galopus ATCC 62051]|nr:hypothetical protein K438DRAFT_349095 [Mycena galopus ATCC 62051]
MFYLALLHTPIFGCLLLFHPETESHCRDPRYPCQGASIRSTAWHFQSDCAAHLPPSSTVIIFASSHRHLNSLVFFSSLSSTFQLLNSGDGRSVRSPSDTRERAGNSRAGLDACDKVSNSVAPNRKIIAERWERRGRHERG